MNNHDEGGLNDGGVIINLAVIGKAKLMYQEFQKASFPFEHCWNVLRYQPKWLEECEKKKPKKKKTSATSSPFTPEAINLAEDDVSHDAYVDLERPLGRKAEKERLNKRKSKDSAGSNYAGILNGIMEDKKKANDKKIEILEKACLQEQEQNRINQELEQERIRIMKEEIQERFRIKQEKIRAEQLKEEERIIMMDTNGLSPMQQQYYLHRQMEILESQRSTK
ncbi:hypothetical protein LOK49_LG07G00817 [Camellia lanceoleosa]|uniref:Uncharacterized protein n=1 Tax=Camellia lanceoleosa TaxID=1840588 RepID=A0ACC0H5B0_9ERIC|nr:hypothetical protein LOK49_LG07G00817 [Camellia lanceoleosa]